MPDRPPEGGARPGHPFGRAEPSGTDAPAGRARGTFPGFPAARRTSGQVLVAVIREAWTGGVLARRAGKPVQATGLNRTSKIHGLEPVGTAPPAHLRRNPARLREGSAAQSTERPRFVEALRRDDRGLLRPPPRQHRSGRPAPAQAEVGTPEKPGADLASRRPKVRRAFGYLRAGPSGGLILLVGPEGLEPPTKAL